MNYYTDFLLATRQNFGEHVTPQIDIGCPAISDSSEPSIELNIRTNASIWALLPAMFNSIASGVFSIELDAWTNALIGEIVPPAFCETFPYE
jgi:hypothetical protein